MPVTRNNVDDVFTYHSPIGDQPARYEAIRAKARELARVILDNTNGNADQQAAIRLLRECVMTANAAVALEGMI